MLQKANFRTTDILFSPCAFMRFQSYFDIFTEIFQKQTENYIMPSEEKVRKV